MRKILLFLLVILSFQAFGQTPPGYQSRIVRERIQGSFMVDSALHIPRYNGTPSGVRGGGSIQDGAIAMDTLNHLFYYYSGGTWRIISGNNIYNSNGILDANRTLTGLNNTYSLNFDSLNSWRVQRNGITRFSMSSTTSSMIGANTNAAFTANSTQAIVNYQGNALRVAVDSSTITKILSYETNINGSLTPNAHATKSYVDSVLSGVTNGIDAVLAVGEPLSTDRTIDGNGYSLNVTSSVDDINNGTLNLSNTNGGMALNSIGLASGSTIPKPARLDVINGDNNDFLASLEIGHEASVGANDIASGMFFKATTTLNGINSPNSRMGYIAYRWIDATDASRTAQIEIGGYSGGFKNFLRLRADRLFANNDQDTVAYLSDVRAGGGGVTSVGSGFGTNFSTITTTGSVVVDSTSGGVTSWVRTKFILDSLQAAGWGAQTVNYEPWYQYYLTTTGGIGETFYGASGGSGATILNIGVPGTASPDGWMNGQRMSTGTTNSGISYHYAAAVAGSDYTSVSINSSFRYNYGEKVRFEDLSDGTETYNYYTGFMDDVSAFGSVVDGAGFRYQHADSSGTWIAWTKSNSTLTEDATAITVAADTDYELEVSVIGGTAYFYINKVLATSIATNVPSGSSRVTAMGNHFQKSNGTTARLVYIEWMAYGKRHN